MPPSVDASNACIPESGAENLLCNTPPLPTTTRGVPLSLHGEGGRFNSDKPLLVYPSGRLVVVRELTSDLKNSGGDDDGGGGKMSVKSFVYRGHSANGRF